MLEFETVLSKGRNIRVHPTGYIQVDIVDGPFEVWVWHNSFSNDLVSIPPVVAFSSTLNFLVERGGVIWSTPTVVGEPNGYYKRITLNEHATSMGESGFGIKSNWFDERHTVTKFDGKFTFPVGQPRRIFGYTSDHSILVVRKEAQEFVSTHMLMAESINEIDLSRFQVSPKQLWDLLEQVF